MSIEKTVADNLRYLEQRLLRVETAPLGPTSVEYGEGSLVFKDANGADRTVIDGDDLLVRYKGSTQSLEPVLKNKTDYSYVDGNVRTLVANDAALGERIDAEAATRKSADDGIISTLNAQVGRLDGVDASLQRQINDRYTKGQIDSAFGVRDSRISTAQSTADSGVSKANAAQSTANSGVSKANAAQSTADSARAAANAAQSQVDRLEATQAGNMNAVRNAINKLASLHGVNPWA